MLTEAARNSFFSQGSSIKLFYGSCFFNLCCVWCLFCLGVVLILVFCFFIWLDSGISKVSRFFNLILKLLEYLGFLFWRAFLSLCFHQFKFSISEICGLCLLDSFFQGNLFWGVSGGWLVVWVLWHINLCSLFNAKSILIQIISSISNNLV